MKYLWFVVGGWALVIIATIVFYFELWNSLYIFIGYWIVGCGLVAAFIGCVVLIALFKERSKLSPALALVAVFGLFLLLIYGPGSRWGALARFYLTKWSYETTVAKVISARNESEKQKMCAGKCEIELGDGAEPKRIVFPLTSDDVMFGWTGLVYDPEGGVAKAQRNKDSFFGCMFLGAEHLRGDWYLCSFWHR